MRTYASINIIKQIVSNTRERQSVINISIRFILCNRQKIIFQLTGPCYTSLYNSALAVVITSYTFTPRFPLGFLNWVNKVKGVKAIV